MKPAENIEEFVRFEKPHVMTGPKMDKRTLKDAFAAMDEILGANKPNAARRILRSRGAKLAAAAAIIVSVGLLMVYRNPPAPPKPRHTDRVAKSPAEMLTGMSLNMAWRRGGIKAIDEQSSRAFKMLNAKPAKETIQELLVELNGV